MSHSVFSSPLCDCVCVSDSTGLCRCFSESFVAESYHRDLQTFDKSWHWPERALTCTEYGFALKPDVCSAGQGFFAYLLSVVTRKTRQSFVVKRETLIGVASTGKDKQLSDFDRLSGKTHSCYIRLTYSQFLPGASLLSSDREGR